MEIKQLIDINKEYIGQNFETTVLISDIKVKASRNGKRYADLIVQDASK